MTILYINTGSSPNKGDGDTLRTAFTKINANFGFLSTSSGGVNTIIAGSGIHISTSTGNVIISATGSGSGNGNIIQSATAPIPASTTTLWYDTVGGRTYTYFEGVWVDTNPANLSIPIASTTELGGVKVDGTTITINSTTGVISANNTATGGGSAANGWELTSGTAVVNLSADGVVSFPQYRFPATHGQLGQVLVDNGAGILTWSDTNTLVNGSYSLNLANNGNISLPTSYTNNSLLQSASPITLDAGGSYAAWTFDTSGNLTLPTPPAFGPKIQAFGTGMILEVTGTAGSYNFPTGTTTTNYVTMSPGVTFGTGAFTIEGWVYFDNFLAPQPALGTTTSSGGLSLVFANNDTIVVDCAGVGQKSFTIGAATSGGWHHFAVARDNSGNEMAWLDGNPSTSGVQVDSFNYSGVTSLIGKTYNSLFFGQLSAIRIVQNAIYTPAASTITVPTLFPVSQQQQVAGTVLSLPMINPQYAFVDRTNFPNSPVQTITVVNEVDYEVNGNPNIALGTQGPIQTFTFHKYGAIRFPDYTEQFTAFTGTVAWSNITGIPDLAAVSTASINNGVYSISIGPDGYLNLPNGLDGQGALIQSTNPIRINSQGNFWTFNNDGTIVFPDSTVQPTAFNPYRHTVFYGQVTFNSTVTNNYAANATTTTNILELHQPTGGHWTFDDAKDIGIQFDYYNNTVNSNATATIILAHDTQWFEFYSNGGFDGSQSQFHGTQYATIKAGTLVLANSTASITFADGSLQTTAWTGTVASLTNDGQAVTLHVGGRTTLPGDSVGTNFFNFNVDGDGSIHFPDGTIQHTAYEGQTGTNSIDLSAIDRDIIPNLDSTYDLGSPSHQWKSLYVSTNTIYVGNVPLTVDTATNTLLVNGSQVSGSGGSATTSTLVNNSYAVSLDSSGNLYIPSYISNTNTGSYGLELVAGYPGQGVSIANNSGYQVVFVQDDGAYVQTSANNSGTVFHTWTFGLDGSTTFPNGSKLDVGTPYKFATDNSVTQYIDLRDASGRGFYTDSNGYTLRSNNGNNWIFRTSGVLALPYDSYLETTDTNLKVGSHGQVVIRSNAATDVGTKAWTFGADGSLTFPDSSVQTTAYPGTKIGGAINIGTTSSNIFIPNTNYQALGLINSLAGVYIEAGTPQQVWQFNTDGTLTLPGSLTGDSVSIQGAPVTITITDTGGVWGGAPGTYTRLNGITPPKWAPANYNPSSDSSITYDGGWQLNNPNFGHPVYVNTGTLFNPSATWDPDVQFGLGSGNPAGAYTYNNWTFNSTGSLTFPDTTVQTTAFTASSYISKATLQSIISTCTSFTEFKNAILGL